MGGALDTKARATAEKLLQKFGKVATYQKDVEGIYNPVTGDVPITTTTYPITCYIDKPTSGEIQAGLADVKDAVILVSAKELGVDAESGDSIDVGDVTYSIKSDMPVWSGELIALHRLVSVIR
jgi:hypothetical protein